MMKKSIALLLVLVMVLSVLAGCAKKDEAPVVSTPDPAPTVDTPAPDVADAKPTSPQGQITIGSITELTGDWVPFWTNNAADYDIYNFITGYGTVDMTFGGEFLINDTVVKKYEALDNENGSKTYTFTINDGLTYGDGSPIKAYDYAAYAMFWASNQAQNTGVQPDVGLYFEGYDKFNKGESKIFSGVRLIDDMTFSITIAAEKLPYFFELPNIDVSPLKLAFWTDETVTIKDDGEGCYFSDNFTTEAFEERFKIARYSVADFPITGAYNIKSYDESSKVAVLEINDKYIGDYTGQKPLIQTVIYKKVTSETALDELSTGGVDLLSQMASGDEINGGIDLVDKGGFDFVSYPRAGYGKLTFSCDFGPTKDVEVRQAIAHLIDRNDFAKAFTGGFGTVVNGPYGESMWFYQETKAELDAKLDPYAYGLENAKALLVKAGWTLDANGNEYKEGLRHKKTEDGKIIPLVIEWASSEQNPVSALLVVKLQENPDVAAAGMKINQTVMTFGDLLNYLYRDGTIDKKYDIPTYGMFNLATNYNPRYDLSQSYTTDPAKLKTGINQNYIVDTKLEDAAKAMVLLAAEDKDVFKAKFVEFVERWNELLPDLPLYSNLYHDFFNNKLKDYEKNPLIRVDKALLYSYVAE